MSEISESELNKELTDKQILELDFYDFCGSASVGMTVQQKLDYWKKKRKQSEKQKRKKQIK